MAINDAVAYWSFDLDLITDVSGNGNTLTNSGVTSTTGKINNGGRYNSGESDYEYVSGTTLIPATGDFTFVGWASSDDISSHTIVAQNTNTGHTGRFLVFFSNLGGNPAVYVQLGGSNILIGSALTTSTLYHVMLIRSGTSWELYVNNALHASTTNSTAIEQTDTYLGRYGPSSTVYHNGVLDEIGIWTKAFNSSERAESYNGGVGFNPYTGADISKALSFGGGL